MRSIKSRTVLVSSARIVNVTALPRASLRAVEYSRQDDKQRKLTLLHARRRAATSAGPTSASPMPAATRRFGPSRDILRASDEPALFLQAKPRGLYRVIVAHAGRVSPVT